MSRMKRILIGYDGSKSADHAIADLERAGLPESLDAVVLTASDFVLPASVKGFGMTGLSSKQIDDLSTQSVKDARVTADKAAKRLKSLFPRWKIKVEASAESPIQAILNKARAWKSDLIVVGAHGHSKIGRFLGSVSQLVLAQAPCSVRIGRLGKLNRKEMRVAIAFDGSSGAEMAAEAAGFRQWPSNTHFYVSYVLDRASIGVLQPERYRAAAGEMMKDHVKPFFKQLSNVTFRLNEGDPKQVIVDEAEKWNAYCIFIGARKLSSTRRLFLGGVSMAVAARAHCTVEVIRPKN